MVSFSFSVLCLYFCHFRGGGRKKRCIGIKRKREKREGISAQTSKCLEAKNPIQPNPQCVQCLNVFLLETKSSSDFQEIWRWCVETLNLKKKKSGKWNFFVRKILFCKVPGWKVAEWWGIHLLLRQDQSVQEAPCQSQVSELVVQVLAAPHTLHKPSYSSCLN